MTNEQAVIEKVSAQLMMHQHSAAYENIISSLLTAALNENPYFMRWFCCEKAGLNRNTKPKTLDYFYAMANQATPKLLHVDTNSRPDIIVADYETGDWGDLIYNENEKALAEIRAIFIEVKRTNLSLDDKEKYIRFIKEIKGKCNTNRVKFFIISAHKEQVIKRLKKDKEWKKDEHNWNKLLNCIDNQYKAIARHITLDEIRQYKPGYRFNNEYLMCHLLRSYLNLVFMPSGRGDYAEKYWGDIFEDYLYKEDKYGIGYIWFKNEIMWHIEELATINGFFEGDWGRNRKEIKLKKWGIITFPDNPDDSVKIDEDPDVPNDDKTKMFKVIIPPKHISRFTLDLEGKEKTVANICKNMEKISKGLASLIENK